MRHDVENCDIENCFGCKAATMQFGGVRGSRERNYEDDNAAYRRLRAEGLQPKTVTGAAAKETRANTRSEVEA